MHEARILHIEDNEELRRTIEDVLSVRGVHRVVSWADTVAQAYQRLEEISEDKGRTGRRANVILLDGHLRGGQAMNHPKVIIDKMRELGLTLPIIGLSADGLTERGLALGRDMAADITKSRLGRDIQLLDRVLDKLPEPEIDSKKKNN